MRNLITVFLIFLSHSIFCQNQETQLKEAFSKKSDSLLLKFFNSWQNGLMTSNVNRQNNTLKIVNNIFEDIYSNEVNHSQLDNDKYTLIDTRKLIIDVVKEDSETNDLINRIYQLEKSKNINNKEDKLNSLCYELKEIAKSTKIDTLNNFNPTYKNHKVLYLNNNYNNIFQTFLVEYGKHEDRERFLRNKIKDFFFNGRRFSPNDRINKIILFISMKFAIVEWDDGYCNGKRYYLLNNHNWEPLSYSYEECE